MVHILDRRLGMRTPAAQLTLLGAVGQPARPLEPVAMNVRYV